MVYGSNIQLTEGTGESNVVDQYTVVVNVAAAAAGSGGHRNCNSNTNHNSS